MRDADRGLWPDSTGKGMWRGIGHCQWKPSGEIVDCKDDTAIGERVTFHAFIRTFQL